MQSTTTAKTAKIPLTASTPLTPPKTSSETSSKTPLFDELTDLLLPASNAVTPRNTDPEYLKYHVFFSSGKEALMSFIGACFSGQPSYSVKQGIYTYIDSPVARRIASSRHSSKRSSRHSKSSSDRSFANAVALLSEEDFEYGLAVLNVLVKRMLGSELCFSIEKNGRNIYRYDFMYNFTEKQKDKRLITISGFNCCGDSKSGSDETSPSGETSPLDEAKPSDETKSSTSKTKSFASKIIPSSDGFSKSGFNYLDIQLISNLTRGRDWGFHGFLWLSGYNAPSFVNPPADVFMCCNMREKFEERMTAIQVNRMTKEDLLKHFNNFSRNNSGNNNSSRNNNSGDGNNSINSFSHNSSHNSGNNDSDSYPAFSDIEDLMSALIAEKAGIVENGLATFREKYFWIYREF